MNFFQAQAKAKKHTFLLVLLFSVAIIALIAIALFALIVGLAYMDTQDLNLALTHYPEYVTPVTVGIASALVLGVVAFGSVTMFFHLRAGGSVIAQELGGEKISANTQDFYQKRLLNVVEEMAIASGVSMPDVYILPGNESINAFAAGHSMDDVVIGVTQGLIETLDREELQGVIAHEFSHIFNGDMRLNMRLTGMLHGILMMGIVGRLLLRVVSRSGSSSRRSSKKEGGSGIAIIVVIGVVFFVVGYVGNFIGAIIKAMISRKREYLADATAVQYTRYPQGIAGALKKIGGISRGSTIESGAATTYSHLYFSQGVSEFFSSLLATHPPLEQRILAIDPQWNGVYPVRVSRISQARDKAAPKSETKAQRKERFKDIAIIAGGMHMGRFSQADEAHKNYARNFLENLDETLKAELDNPMGAQLMLLSLLSDKKSAERSRQWSAVEDGLAQELPRVYEMVKELPRAQYIHLIQLALPSLKQTTQTQYETFKKLMMHFIEIDNKMNFFEWSLYQSVTRPLDRYFGLSKPTVLVHYSLGAIRQESALLLSLLAQMQYADEEKAREVFKSVIKTIGAGALEYKTKKEIDFEAFKQAIAAIERAKMPIKERIMEAVVLSLKADSRLSSLEIEMLHALAAVLELPLPPLEV